MKKLSLLAVLLVSMLGLLQANTTTKETALKDTLYTELKTDIVILSSTKETNSLRTLPAAVSILSPKRLDALQIKNLKGLSSFIPNYSVADYGSKMTAPIYIRGIGARSGTQTVSMYVDNIPYFNTTSFDIELMDIQRIEVLRGTQSTLYGRNAMGGLLNIYTYSPLDYQGTKLQIGAGSYGEFNQSVSHYRLLKENVGLATSAYYKRNDGYFRNTYNGKKIDKIDNLGGRMKLEWQFSPRFSMNLSTSFDFVKQGAFPYENIETEEIAFKSNAYYNRKLSTTGLALRYIGDGFEINSTTGYQYLNDDMNMDQDYTVADVFQINQRQNEHSLSQELTIKSKNESNMQWSAGAFGFYDYLKTTAPVYMMRDGIDKLIASEVNHGMVAMERMIAGIMKQAIQKENPLLPEATIDKMVAGALSKIPSKVDITDDEIVLGGLYANKVYGGAVFAQGTYNNLFAKGLSLTAGARLDYEKTRLDYESVGAINFDLYGEKVDRIKLNSPTAIIGNTSDDFFEFLPKAVLKYEFNPNNYIYASAARGYKTGGHNIQMFADLLQGQLNTDMTKLTIQEILKFAPGVLPPGGIQMGGGSSGSEDVSNRISFKPEYSWSYEFGGKFDIIKERLTANIAAYYMDIKDIQVTQFVISGGGRRVANGGKAKSQGLEFGLNARPCSGVFLYANYGFSDAKFKDYIYQAADAERGKEEISYSGNYIPFAPRMTYSFGGSVYYDMKKCSFLDRISFDANYAGTGKIYWDEANTFSQGSRGELNSKIAFQKNNVTFEIYAQNLLNKKYHSFVFSTTDHMSAEQPKPSIYLGQLNKPIRFGANLKINL